MDLKIVIENPKGSYKSFETENDPLWNDYPLKGITYPVDYGYADGYKGEDGHELDFFVGTGSLNGYIKVWRKDVPIETKFIRGATEVEWNEIVKAFQPVIKESRIISDESEFEKEIGRFKI